MAQLVDPVLEEPGNTHSKLHLRCHTFTSKLPLPLYHKALTVRRTKINSTGHRVKSVNLPLNWPMVEASSRTQSRLTSVV